MHRLAPLLRSIKSQKTNGGFDLHQCKPAAKTVRSSGLSYWLDMDDRTLVMVMTKGIGANLTNNEKRARLMDIKREHQQVCPKEILLPEK
jgi:hypothetical protein